MDKRAAAVTTILIIIGIGLFSALAFMNSQPTIFRYHEDYPIDSTKSVFLRVENLQDCVLNIEFDDDDTLLFDIGIELYEAGTDFHVYLDEVSSSYEININTNLDSPVRIKEINITLGSGHYTKIYCGVDSSNMSSNVHTNVEITNGAVVGGLNKFYFPGSVYFDIDDNIVLYGTNEAFTAGIITYDVGRQIAGSAHINVDVAPEVNGDADFNSTSRDVTLVGWILRDSEGDRYRYWTESVETPRVSVITWAESITAALIQ